MESAKKKERKELTLIHLIVFILIAVLILPVLTLLIVLLVGVSPALLLGYLGQQFFVAVKTIYKMRKQYQLKKLKNDKPSIFTRRH